MIQAVEEVHQSGEAMSSTAREFATDPCSSAKRGNMVRALFISRLKRLRRLSILLSSFFFLLRLFTKIYNYEFPWG